MAYPIYEVILNTSQTTPDVHFHVLSEQVDLHLLLLHSPGVDRLDCDIHPGPAPIQRFDNIRRQLGVRNCGHAVHVLAEGVHLQQAHQRPRKQSQNEAERVHAANA